MGFRPTRLINFNLLYGHEYNYVYSYTRYVQNLHNPSLDNLAAFKVLYIKRLGIL